MTMNKTVINDYGKKLTKMRDDFNDHVLNMMNKLDNDKSGDLSTFDIKISFGDRQYELGLTSSLSESMSELINSQLDEYGTDYVKMTDNETILMLTDYILTTNSDLPLDTPISNESTLMDVKQLFEKLSK